MKPFYSKIVNNLAKGCFTVFLLQNTFIRKLHIDKYINGNVLLLLFHLLLNCVVIYIICWIIYIIYTVITKPFFKMLEKKLLWDYTNSITDFELTIKTWNLVKLSLLALSIFVKKYLRQDALIRNRLYIYLNYS